MLCRGVAGRQSFCFSSLLQPVHVTADVVISDLGVHLCTFHAGVSHHLGDTFQADAFRYEHRAEGVTGHVSREVFSPADGKAYLVDVRPGTVEGRQREDGVFVVSGVIHIEYLLCYGVQWDERLHFRLLSVDADIAPTVGCRADVVGIEATGINVCKSRQAGEDKPVAEHLHAVVCHRG